ncbi:MAG: hypothetical protein CNIPEHKO_02711 [Anaerolineales bacterium]|nr:hypothetical protein [Anaerolineales bacterium]
MGFRMGFGRQVHRYTGTQVNTYTGKHVHMGNLFTCLRVYVFTLSRPFRNK